MSETNNKHPDDATESDVSAAAESSEQESGEPSGANRRRHDRLPMRAEISLSSESNLYAGLTGDISEGGIFVATYQMLPAGTVVDLEVSFEEANGPRIAVKAEVRWVRDEHAGKDSTPGMGLRFLDLAEEHQVWIAEFVQRRDPIFFEDLTTGEKDFPVAAPPLGSDQDVDLVGSKSPLTGLALLVGVIALVAGLAYLLFASGDDGSSQSMARVTPSAGSPVAEPESVSPPESQPAIAPVGGDGGAASQPAASQPATDAGELATAMDGDGAVVVDGGATKEADASPPDGPVADASAAEPAVVDAAVRLVPDSAPDAEPAAPADKSAPARAGLQVAELLRGCLGTPAKTIRVKIALFVQASGKVVRGFVAPSGGSKMGRREISCVRKDVRGVQLPLTLRKADFVEWVIDLGSDEPRVRLTKPRYLRR